MGATVAALTIGMWVVLATIAAVIIQLRGLVSHVRHAIGQHQQSGFSLLLSVPAGLLGIFSIGFSLDSLLIAVVFQAIFLVGVINLAIVAGRYWEYMVVSSSQSTIRSGILRPAGRRSSGRSHRKEDGGIYDMRIERWTPVWFRSYGLWTVDRWDRGPSYARLQTRSSSIEIRPGKARLITEDHVSTGRGRMDDLFEEYAASLTLPEELQRSRVHWQTVRYGQEVAVLQRPGEQRVIVTTESVPVVRQQIQDAIMQRTVAGAVATLISLVPVMFLFAPA